MPKILKNALLLLASVAIVIFTIIGLGRDIFHAIEEIVYDHQATILTNSAFSRLTNKVALFAGVVSLFLIPSYILGLVDKDFNMNHIVYSMKFICSILLLVVMGLVITVFFPLYCVLEGFTVGFRAVFLGDCLYSHVLIPILFVLSFFLLDDRQKLSQKEPIIVTLILTLYLIVYVFFVFIIKTWTDFYFIKDTANVISYFSIALLAVVVIVAVYFASCWLSKVISKK